MNVKQAKKLRKELKIVWKEHERTYQCSNNRKQYDREGQFTGMGPGTIKAMGARRAYQDIKKEHNYANHS